MTITAVTAAALTTLLGEFGPEYFQRGISQASPLLASKSLKKVDPDGEEYVVDLYPSANHATGFVLDGGRMPIGGSGAPLKARGLPSVLVSILSQGRAAAKMKLSDGRRTKMLDAELRERSADCGRVLNRAILGASVTANADTTWNTTAANGVATVAFLDVSMFREGMAVDFRDASASKAYVVRVQSVTFAVVGANSANVAGNVVFINDVVDPSTNAVIALTDVNITAANDIFSLRGMTAGFGAASSFTAQGAVPNSFDSIAGSAANAVAAFMGQDPATMGIGYNWRANFLNLAGVYSQEAVLAFAARVGTISDVAPDVAVVHPQTAAAHRASGDFHASAYGSPASAYVASRQVPLDKTMDKYGKPYKGSGLSVAGAEIVEDPNCQVGRIILFNSEYTKLCVWDEMGPDEEAGDPTLLGRTFYTSEVQFSGLYQLVSDKRSTIGIIDGITNM